MVCVVLLIDIVRMAMVYDMDDGEDKDEDEDDHSYPCDYGHLYDYPWLTSQEES